MKKDDYILLIYKCLKGEQTAAETRALEDWTAASEANRQLREQLEEEWRLSSAYQPQLEVDVAGDFERLRQRMRTHKAKAAEPEAIQRSLPGRRRWLSIAAAVAVLIVAAMWWSSRGEVAAERLLAETGAGEQKSITLQDGTVVALNENSRLWYPETFASGERRVELQGEGFFEVTRNETAPFIINTPLVDVKVLGTSFNLLAYADQPKAELSVESGRVQMISKQRPQDMILTAGQKGVYADEEMSKLGEASPNAGAWRNKLFRFKESTLGEVIADLERVFDASIQADPIAKQKCVFTGRIQNTQLQPLLALIATALELELEQQDANSYLLKGSQCE